MRCAAPLPLTRYVVYVGFTLIARYMPVWTYGWTLAVTQLPGYGCGDLVGWHCPCLTGYSEVPVVGWFPLRFPGQEIYGIWILKFLTVYAVQRSARSPLRYVHYDCDNVTFRCHSYQYPVTFPFTVIVDLRYVMTVDCRFLLHRLFTFDLPFPPRYADLRC